MPPLKFLVVGTVDEPYLLELAVVDVVGSIRVDNDVVDAPESVEDIPAWGSWCGSLHRIESCYRSPQRME